MTVKPAARFTHRVQEQRRSVAKHRSDYSEIRPATIRRRFKFKQAGVRIDAKTPCPTNL